MYERDFRAYLAFAGLWQQLGAFHPRALANPPGSGNRDES